MPNIIGTKKHLFVCTLDKQGRVVQHEVRSNRSDYKIVENIQKHIEESTRRKKA